MIKRVLALALCAAACNTDPAAPAETGFAFQITETDTRIEIAAFDATELRGQVVLEKGRFEIPDTGGVIADGRRLTVKLGTLQVEHVSAGYPDLHLPLLSGGVQGLNMLLTAPEVVAPLARWGVRFSTEMRTGPTGIDPPTLPESQETPYATCRVHSAGDSSPFTGCQPCTYATTSTCAATACRQFTGAGGEAQQFVACNGPLMIAQRACTSPMGSTSCGPAGPNGCAVCWTTFIFDWAELGGSGGACTWRNCQAWCGSIAC
jgi:hypothetical protein